MVVSGVKSSYKWCSPGPSIGASIFCPVEQDLGVLVGRQLSYHPWKDLKDV